MNNRNRPIWHQQVQYTKYWLCNTLETFFSQDSAVQPECKTFHERFFTGLIGLLTFLFTRT